jgi:hypothetical protein
MQIESQKTSLLSSLFYKIFVSAQKLVERESDNRGRNRVE